MSNNGLQKTYIVEYRYINSNTSGTYTVNATGQFEAQALAMIALNTAVEHPVVVTNVKPR